MKWLVCGGRNLGRAEDVWADLDSLVRTYGKPRVVIEGGALGADRHARLWAYAHNVHVATVNALWGRQGKAAGPMRNAAMLDLSPSLVIAYPGGTGTANMIQQAEAANVKVLRRTLGGTST